MDMGGPAPVEPVSGLVVRERANRDAPQREPPRASFAPDSAPEEEDVVSDTAARLAADTGDSPSGAVPGDFLQLLAEIERLRGEIDLARHHIAWLEERCDRHPDVAVSNRHAFLRTVGLLLRQSGASGAPPGMLAAFRTEGIEGLRHAQGIAAGDAVLDQQARILAAGLRQGDLLGYRDGGVFLTALCFMEVDEAKGWVARLAAALAGVPVDRPEWRRFLTVVPAYLPLDASRTPDALLDEIMARLEGRG